MTSRLCYYKQQQHFNVTGEVCFQSLLIVLTQHQLLSAFDVDIILFWPWSTCIFSSTAAILPSAA